MDCLSRCRLRHAMPVTADWSVKYVIFGGQSCKLHHRTKAGMEFVVPSPVLENIVMGAQADMPVP